LALFSVTPRYLMMLFVEPVRDTRATPWVPEGSFPEETRAEAERKAPTRSGSLVLFFFGIMHLTKLPPPTPVHKVLR
jgi:hypothetical protein